MPDSLTTTTERVGAALLTSLAVVGLAFVFTDLLPILPALLVAVWLPLFARRDPFPLSAGRLMLVATGALAALAGLGALVLVIVQT